MVRNREWFGFRVVGELLGDLFEAEGTALSEAALREGEGSCEGSGR